MNFLRRHISLVIATGAVLAISAYLWFIPWSQAILGPLYGPEALTDPYLAASKFLERQNVVIERGGNTQELGEALQDADILVMTNQKGDFTEAQVADLFDWIRSGGTLIYQPTTLYIKEGNFQDVLLMERDLRLIVNPAKILTRLPALDVHHTDVTCVKASTPTRVAMDQQEYQVDVPQRLLLQTPSAAMTRPIFVSDNLGPGKLIILTGLAQWRNNMIQCHDNARFLHDLVVSHDGSSVHMVWLERIETEPLYMQIWEWFPHTIATLGLLLLLWLWNRIPRDQFIEKPVAVKTHSLEDYLTRKASFRWRYANSLAQLKQLRIEVGGNRWQQLDQSDYDQLSTATGVAASDIRAAFMATYFHDRDELIKIVTTLNRMRGLI